MSKSLLSAATLLALLHTALAAAAAEKPVPPDQAAARFQLPGGFRAVLVAGEPDVVQPIAMTTDDSGRLWVVECYSYPEWKPDRKDRVLIFEDRNGDGRFDRRTVFWDQGSNLSGIALGFGGVWLCSTPNLVFVPDADGDDRPDGPPVVKLDGWDLSAKHNVFNGLVWGPDGWLYGCNGILSNSKVGKPGTPEAQRVKFNCGVWRFHPRHETFEVFAHGTTNPWGLDFDQFGEAFITNCVIKHAFHVVQGGHYERMFGQDVTPGVYQLLPSCADHIHWAGGPWTEARGGELHDAAGGGHAHSGALIYQGENWPAEYRHSLLTCNIHGNRINRDRLERQGSGYVARHAADLMRAGDPWFRGVALCQGPDGGVFVSDWSDSGECHDYEEVHRSSGRIYKITYGDPRQFDLDLAKLPDEQLVDMQPSQNQWLVRHARRILQERQAAGRLDDKTPARLKSMVRQAASRTSVARLRLLWALYAVEGVDEQLLDHLSHDADETLRSWAVRLELDNRAASPAALERLQELAANDRSPAVRLALAAGLQRLPLSARWEIATELARYEKDAEDANLPLMIWYGVEPLVAADSERAAVLAGAARIGLVRRLLARRLAEAELAQSGDKSPAILARLVAEATASQPLERTEDIVRGMYDTLQVRRRVPMPAGWPACYARLATSERRSLRQAATALALVFGDQQAIAALRSQAADTRQPAHERADAIAALAQAKVDDLPELLHTLLDDREARVAALRALAAYDDEATAGVVLEKYPRFDAAARGEAISLLASRRTLALRLFPAIRQNVVRLSDVTAYHVEQLERLGDASINSQLAPLRAVVPRTSPERKKLIDSFRQRLTPEVLAAADLSRGRAVFANACAACHVLFDAGGKIGPELTGAQRTNLDFVLVNLLDPSALVAKDFQVTVFQTSDGRVVSGIVQQENAQGVAVQTANEVVLLPKEEIEQRKQTNVSLMPEGLLSRLSDAEVRDLVGYLAAPQQVPLPKESQAP